MPKSDKHIAGDETVHYVSAREKRAQPKAKMQPPLTPMIDVTFQLLLFFLLTFTFREAEGQIPGSLPEEGTGGISAQQQLERPVTITLRPTGRHRESVIYEISDLSVSPQNAEDLFRQLLARAQKVGLEVPVVIKPNGNVRWEYVVDAFNQAIAVKFKNIGFAPSS